MKALLIGREGDREFSYEIRRPTVTIGRDPASDVIVADSACSRKHALIERNDEEWTIRDLGSRNGTFVNDTQVNSPKPLRWGDRVRVGSMMLLFVTHKDAAKKKVSTVSSQRFKPKTVGVNVSGFDLSYVKKPRPGHMNVLLETALRLPGIQQPDQAREEFLEILLRDFEASRAALLTYAEEGPEIRATRVRTASEMYPKEVEFDPELVRLVRAADRAFLQDDQYSSIYVPLHEEGRVRGLLYLDNFLQSQRLGEDDLWVVYAAGRELTAVQAGQAQRARLEKERLQLEEQLAAGERFVGESQAVRAINDQIVEAAPTNSIVLILGERGTGKDLLARTIHLDGPRRAGPYVALNCAAKEAEEFERDLFGAAEDPGAFERASGGTLFLDDVGELPMELQDRLAGAVRAAASVRLGSTDPVPVDVRLIVGSNDSLKGMVSLKRLREALGDAGEFFEIRIPPLRDRPEDIPPLVEYFVERLARELGRRVRSIEPAALERLSSHPWKGNVRELRLVLERAMLEAPGPSLSVADLQRVLPATPEA